jgi:hypothetical protein
MEISKGKSFCKHARRYLIDVIYINAVSVLT